MTTALALKDVEFIADDLPGHEQALAAYEASGLEARDAFMLEAHAAKILTVAKRGILEIGQELLEARERAKHGTWGAFLKRAQLEERTAQNYMHVAERFSDKPDVAGLLSSGAMIALSAPSAPADVFEGIVEEVRASGVAPRPAEVKQRLADARPTPPPPVRPAPAPVQLTPRPAAPPAPAGDDEEIAAPPAPAGLPRPLMITPIAPQPSRTALLVKRELLRVALELVEQELAAVGGAPAVEIDGDVIAHAARMFLANPALGGATAMLGLSVRVVE